jgi:hypothetical protein
MLHGLLLQALETDDSLVKAASAELLSLRARDLLSFLHSLHNLAIDPRSDPRAVALALVLARCSLGSSDDLLADFETCELLCHLSFRLVSSRDPDVGLYAAELLGTAGSFLLRDPSYVSLFTAICETIDSNSGTETLQYLLRAVSIIIETVPLDVPQIRELGVRLVACFQREALVGDVIRVVSALGDSVSAVFSRNDGSNFMARLLAVTPSVGRVAYDCWRRFVRHSFGLVGFVMGEMIAMVGAELMSCEDPATLLALVRLAKALGKAFSRRDLSDGGLFERIAPGLLRVTAMVGEGPDEASAWGPHQAARKCLALLAGFFPAAASAVLVPQIPGLWQEQTPAARELAVLIVTIELDNISGDLAIEIAGAAISDNNARIRHVGIVLCRKMAKRGDARDYPGLLALASAIANCLADHPANVVAAVRTLWRFAKLPGFPIAMLLPLIAELFTSRNFLVLRVAFDTMADLVMSIDEIGVIATYVEPVIDLMGLSYGNALLGDLQEGIFDLMNTILSKVTIAALPYLEVIWTLYIRANAPHAWLPVASLTDYFDADFEPFLSPTLDFLLEAFRNCEEDGDFVKMFAAFQILLRSPTCEVAGIAEMVLGNADLLVSQAGRILGTVAVALKYHFSAMIPFVSATTEAVRMAIQSRPDDYTLEGIIACISRIAEGGGLDRNLLSLSTQALLSLPLEVSMDVASRAYRLVQVLAEAGEVELLRSLDTEAGVIRRALGPALDNTRLHDAAIQLIQTLWGEQEEEDFQAPSSE